MEWKCEISYKNMTLEEIEKYEHFDFICDGDSKKLIAIVRENPKIDLLDVLRKEIGE